MKFSLEPGEQQLVEFSKKGDLKAFEELIRRYQEVVYRFLFHFTGNPEDAKDISQETFLMLFRKLALYNSSQPFSSWLITIARNLAISFHRKRSPTPIDPEAIAEAIKDFSSGPESEMLSRESCQEIHFALQELPAQSREVLVMRYLLDIPLQQIAEMLNIPEGTAKSRIFKARNELREVIAKAASKKEATQSN